MGPTKALANAKCTGARRGASQHSAATVARVGCSKPRERALLISRSVLSATAAASVRGYPAGTDRSSSAARWISVFV